MIVVIEQHNAHKHSGLIDEMFRLRARVFHDRLKWDVQVVDGKERDKYDDERAVYLIYSDDEGREVKGCLRLLPTTGPTLLADIFSDTMPDTVHVSAPTIWECTRFCIDDRFVKSRPSEGLLFASTIMAEALVNLALKAGIESIIGKFDSSMLRLCRRLGWEVDVLDSTLRYGAPVYLGLCHMSNPAIRRLDGRLKNGHSAFVSTRELAA